MSKKMSQKQKSIQVKLGRKKAQRRLSSKAKQKRDKLLQLGVHQNLLKDLKKAEA
tara:strand:+ start:418 stop:582 length:165 start_codon:yes stop_codon:yes gene_type:complete